MTNANTELVLTAASRLVATAEAADRLRSLPVAAGRTPTDDWCWMHLPDWATDLVPRDLAGLHLPKQHDAATWREYDWWLGAASMLTSAAERQHEAEHGPAHSYLFRIDGLPRPSIDHAWVNRIIMFLRRWWAHENGVSDEAAFGPMPRAVVHLTHDVDAISKTAAIRAKQAVFEIYKKRFGSAARFLLGPADYWQFDTITELESRYGRRSTWNFYGAGGGIWRTPKEHLFDPAYDIRSPQLSAKLNSLVADGHRVGLHPRFDTWRDDRRMCAEKEAIERVVGHQVSCVRQHWLRFSFAETWRAQRAAGLTHDFTLGFNDQFGFRNGAALSFVETGSGMQVTPLVLMDSHLFDYADMGFEDCCRAIDDLLDELVFTGGEASIVWHQRVFHADYGWGNGYEYLLDGMNRRGITSPEGY